MSGHAGHGVHEVDYPVVCWLCIQVIEDVDRGVCSIVVYEVGTTIIVKVVRIIAEIWIVTELWLDV